jgi:hypothetical protein
MAEMNTIYDADGKIVGIFRFGVAWSKDPLVRLGEYDDTGSTGCVYDNDRNRLVVSRRASFECGIQLSGDASAMMAQQQLHWHCYLASKSSLLYAALHMGDRPLLAVSRPSFFPYSGHLNGRFRKKQSFGDWLTGSRAACSSGSQ